MAYFKKIRDSRIDNFAVETNKLIIRLDKLINDAPPDPSKRKGILESKATRKKFAQQMVPGVQCSSTVCGMIN